jgi:hypothetical protein
MFHQKALTQALIHQHDEFLVLDIMLLVYAAGLILAVFLPLQELAHVLALILCLSYRTKRLPTLSLIIFQGLAKQFSDRKINNIRPSRYSHK